MPIICGCDPGNSGAFAFLNTDACTVSLFDMPVLEYETTKKRITINEHSIAALMQQFEIHHVYMEEVFSSPQMGVTSAFNFGEGKGKIEGVLAALGIPMTPIKPVRWKKDMRVPADKRASVMRASQLIPGAALYFTGPRGGILDGRAEAAMLALYGALELGCAPKKPVTVEDL